MRNQALMVLIYEGIVAGFVDYDYAPQSVSIQNRRIWINVSQEGKSDVEFLREEELISGLQIPARSLQPITCYLINPKGIEIVKKISQKSKDAVHEFVYARGTRDLLSTIWDGQHFYLVSNNGYKRRSSITDIEDVSFVSSAYIPQCLRYGGRPTLSNGHRAHECSVSADNIRDVLDEIITLNSVSIIVAEYIPFGANQIVQLNINVGSTERNQGGFIAPAISDYHNTGETQIQMHPSLTSVNILDYSLTNHVNFEAEINLQEDIVPGLGSKNAHEKGLVQVETFGVSLNAEGTCFYGLQVEAVLDRIKDNISLDHLSRLLVAVQQDSSAIVDTIISPYQREMLQLVFLGDAENRNKVNLIIANEMTPHLTAEEYMDKGEYENELKQVIGDTKAAYDISEHDTLIFGSYGLLVAGPNSRHYEPLLCTYLQFTTIDIFIQNFFTRLWILDDDMQTTYDIILKGERDPNALDRIQYRICKLSNDIIILEEILGYLLEALEIIEIPPEPPEQAGRALYERLEIGGMRTQLLRRAQDLKKNINGSHRFLDVLREMTAVVSESKMFKLNESVNLNTNRMCSLQDSNERSSVLLWNIQSIFSGILAFEFLDRLTGSWSVADSYWFHQIYDALVTDTPFLWFVISIVLWIGTLYFLNYSYKNKHFIQQGLTTIRCRINRKVFLDRLQGFLQSKLHSFEERNYDENSDIVRITYTEGHRLTTASVKSSSSSGSGKNKVMDSSTLPAAVSGSHVIWENTHPIITLEYDERNKYLLTATVQYNRRETNKSMAYTADEIREKIMKELNLMNIWDLDGEDHSRDDLAIDRRIALQKLLDSEMNLTSSNSPDIMSTATKTGITTRGSVLRHATSNK
jgi:hypothetical protein